MHPIVPPIKLSLTHCAAAALALPHKWPILSYLYMPFPSFSTSLHLVNHCISLQLKGQLLRENLEKRIIAIKPTLHLPKQFLFQLTVQWHTGRASSTRKQVLQSKSSVCIPEPGSKHFLIYIYSKI